MERVKGWISVDVDIVINPAGLDSWVFWIWGCGLRMALQVDGQSEAAT
jgi:hypothetical protein